MKPEEVPDDLVIKAGKAAYDACTAWAFPDGSVDETWLEWDPESPEFGPLLDEQRAALAVVLPSYKQSVTAKYRRFVKTVREITRHGESMQTPASEGGGGDECVISPPELRQALRDLRDGRQ